MCLTLFPMAHFHLRHVCPSETSFNCPEITHPLHHHPLVTLFFFPQHLPRFGVLPYICLFCALSPNRAPTALFTAESPALKIADYCLAGWLTENMPQNGGAAGRKAAPFQPYGVVLGLRGHPCTQALSTETYLKKQKLVSTSTRGKTGSKKLIVGQRGDLQVNPSQGIFTGICD